MGINKRTLKLANEALHLGNLMQVMKLKEL